MNLEQLQRAMFDVIRQPLTAAEGMRERTADGRSTKEIVEQIIKPNKRLTSFERLEIFSAWPLPSQSALEARTGMRCQASLPLLGEARETSSQSALGGHNPTDYQSR